MSPLVEHFDHFVVPVDDILAAEDFYTNVLGAQIAKGRNGRPMRYGLNVHHFVHGLRPHTFFIAAGKRIGVYLQTSQRPQTSGLRCAPTYSFETDESGLAVFSRRLAEHGVPFEGPDGGVEGRWKSSIFFSDPAGNHFAIYVPVMANATSAHPRAPDSLLTAVGYLQLEAPDLAASVRFYRETFGLPEAEAGRNAAGDAREARLRLPSGQLLVLTEGEFAPKGMQLSRLEPGPHLAFYLPPERWADMCARLSTLGIPHGDRAAEAKGRTAAELDTYIDDPAGYVVQLISALENV
jgi:catechol 2,3-dioxygenase-like lactoylglutathione lyase family enzyme